MSFQTRIARLHRESDNGKVTLGICLAVVGVLAVTRGSWSTAGTFCFILTVLGLVAATFVLTDRSSDPLHPVGVATLLFAASLAVAPLWLGSFAGGSRPSYGSANIEVLTWSATLSLFGLFSMLAGYLLFRMRAPHAGRGGPVEFEVSGKTKTFMLASAVVIGVVGLVCYLTLVVKAGGYGYLFKYNLGRADMFRGVFGGWFWGMMLLFAAYGLFTVCMIRKHPWWCFTVALVMTSAFFLFQGRDLVIAPLFCWATLYHYGKHRFKWQVVIAGGVLLLTVSAFVGAYRMTSDTKVRADPGRMMDFFFDNLEQQMTRVVVQNIEQLDSVAIAVGYVRRGGDLLGPLALFNWIEPIDRQLFGDSIPTIETGRFMDLLVFPEHAGWNTALSPSLVGELYIALGFVGVIMGMFAYGILLAVMQRWVDSRFRDPVLFAAYPFVSYMIFKMIVDGTGQLFRPILILAVIYLCTRIAPVRRARAFIA